MPQPNKIKILHLINSKGFLTWVKEVFDEEQILNYYCLLDLKNKEVDYIDQDGNRVLSIDKFGQQKMLEIVNSSDIVFHYFLDYTKSNIILKSNKNVRHFWYFFGADVYQQLNVFKKNLYGAEEIKWFAYKWKYRFRLELRALKYLIKGKKTPQKALINSFDRIENVLWYIEDEIKWINERVELPTFKYFRFFKFESVIPANTETIKVDVTKKNMLIGNSASIENNHLEVLKKLIEIKFLGYQIGMPLTYGEAIDYKQFVKQRFSDYFNDSYTPFEEHLPLDQYYSLLKTYPTAIFCHYRQQALGNIFYLLAIGCKVYLSERNIIYNWLKKNHVLVYSFESDFERDYQNDNLILNLESQKSNYSHLKMTLDQKSNFIDNL